MEQEMSTEQQLAISQMNKRIFLARLVGYATFGLILPMMFLIWRFNLFSNTNKLNIGGWGILVIIFSSIFLSKLAKQAVLAIDSVILKQVIEAFRKVFIPLLAVTLCLYAVGDFWLELVRFFGVLTVCEPIAYVLNPFPLYLKEKDDNDEKSKLTKIIELFWDKRK